MSDWRPIETAPKGDITILGFFPTRMGHVARREISPIQWGMWGGGCWEDSTTGLRLSDKPTHWMPLPDNPSDS